MLTRSVLAALSLLAAIAVCEIALRLFLPKYANVAGAHGYQADVSRLYALPPNTTHVFHHPDTGANIPVFYNGFGLRHHREFDAEMLRNGTNVAFFGDSYMENRRVRSVHSFTESLDFFLNLREGAAFNVLNFGVEGYGPGQSLIWYREFEHRDEFDYVVYVFCSNDIEEFDRNGLFHLDESGRLVANTAGRTSSSRSLFSRLHLTYLVLDVAQRMELDVAQRMETWVRGPTASALPSSPSEIPPWHTLKLSEIKQRIARRQQEGSAFSGDALDDSIAAFQALLMDWKRDVEAHGGKFYLAVLPYMRMEWVEGFFPPEIDIVDLHGCYSDAIPNYSWNAMHFENDGHWNETGNMVAAHCLHRLLAADAGLPPLADDVLAEARYEYYQAVALDDGWMPPPTWARPPAAPRHDPDVIRAKYLALEQGRSERLFQLVRERGLLVESDWNVYRVRGSAERHDSLVYVKTPCDEDDMTRRFLLRVDAADPADLPPQSQALGHANLDFSYHANGGRWIGGSCVVAADLPAYGIATVRTGQYSMDDREIAWQVEIAAEAMLRHGDAERAPEEPTA